MPGRACQQNADLAKAEEQKAAARSRYGERREESEGFHRPPAAERRFSIQRALGEGGEGGEGGREQRARQSRPRPSAERRRGGGEGKRGEERKEEAATAAMAVEPLPRAPGVRGCGAEALLPGRRERCRRIVASLQ